MGRLNDLMHERILTLDGATGTMLADRTGRGCCDLLAVDDAAAVEALHRSYIDAGADIITTDTFCSDPLTLASWGLAERCGEIVRAAVRAARRAADAAGREVLVAGSVGPTVRNITLSTDTSEEQLREAYRAVVEPMIGEGADMILVESVCDVRNAEIAVEECRRVRPDIDIVVAAVLSKLPGYLVSGRSIALFAEDLKRIRPTAAGFNCSWGARSVVDNLARLAEATDLCDRMADLIEGFHFRDALPLAAWPSAGVPDASGRFPDSAATFTAEMERAAREGILNIAGGCCGTTPEHIRSLADLCRRYKPARV